MVLLIFSIIVIRVFYVEVIMYDKLNINANNLWSRNLPIGADRGNIYDRNGKLLAGNLTTVSLVLIPNQIDDKEKVAKDLSEILNVSYDEMYKHVSKKTSIERVHPEGRRLDFQTADRISDLHYKGVYLLKEGVRYYPNNNVLSHTLGYVGIDNQGLSGIELTYDKYLEGKDGSIKYYSDGKGNKLNESEIYNSPQDGMDLTLTIDLDLQLSIENELDNIIKKYDPEHALIMAMDPSNGDILGIASRPDFNPNNYKDYDVEVINRNLPIWMTYEPGSTFKIITLSSSINEKTVNLFEDHFYDSGVIDVDGAKIHCWKHGGHKDQTILNVVENSCNPGFVYLGSLLGKERLMKYINEFGFGEKTGIDLNGEGEGILFNLNRMGPVELATTSFGQGISVTPIQQVTAVSAAINGGNLYTPHIVKSISLENNVIKRFDKELKRKVISDDTSKLVRFALESVVANGSGRNAYIENYRIGGKTGTAQKVTDGHYVDGDYILSFIGFMPADNPQIVLYVAIDHPKNVIQYGGQVAAPIAKNILTSAISILNIDSSKDGIPKKYNYYDKKYIMVPDVTGYTVSEANKMLQGFNILYSGDGNKVIYQSPPANTYIPELGTVKLMLGDV